MERGEYVVCLGDFPALLEDLPFLWTSHEHSGRVGKYAHTKRGETRNLIVNIYR